MDYTNNLNYNRSLMTTNDLFLLEIGFNSFAFRVQLLLHFGQMIERSSAYNQTDKEQ